MYPNLESPQSCVHQRGGGGLLWRSPAVQSERIKGVMEAAPPQLIQTCAAAVLAWPLNSSVTLNNTFDLSEPHIPHFFVCEIG